jgi:hypothetical protein
MPIWNEIILPKIIAPQDSPHPETRSMPEIEHVFHHFSHFLNGQSCFLFVNIFFFEGAPGDSIGFTSRQMLRMVEVKWPQMAAAPEIEHVLLPSLSLSQTYTPGLAVFGTACGQPDVSLRLVNRAFIEPS